MKLSYKLLMCVIGLSMFYPAYAMDTKTQAAEVGVSIGAAGTGVGADSKVASAATSAVEPQSIAEKFERGHNYFFGVNGFPEDDRLAIQYLLPVAKQNDDVDLKIRAQYYLGVIYYNSGINKVAGLAYFRAVANQNINEDLKSEAEGFLGRDELLQEFNRKQLTLAAAAKS